MPSESDIPMILPSDMVAATSFFTGIAADIVTEFLEQSVELLRRYGL